MNTIHFVTSNRGKVSSLQNRLGKNAIVERLRLDVPEIQADSAEVIARFKARYAYKQVRLPLLMQDSAFHVRALYGFPGPYIKYINETIGPEGLLDLMKGKADRYCHFEHVAVYIDGRGKEHVFRSGEESSGSIATERYEPQNVQSWSDLWQIFIPHWASRPLAALSREEIDRHEQEDDKQSDLYRFAEWYKSHVGVIQ
ncbi:MAG TPA: non-canonical purine NTP pyrophosphatase [Candidatus Saccharimonadales bacterium]|jgi:non-canonical purine NTP pyrophosphatase (RdgB/HAM1 family)